VLFHLWGGTARVKVGGRRAKFACSNIEEFGRVTIFDGEKEYMNRVMALVRPGDTVWDIGANIGTHTTFLGLEVGSTGRVYGFEPEPHLAKKAEASGVLNGLDNLEILQIGLSDSDGVGDLSIDESPGSGKHRFGELGSAETIEVKISRGDSLIESAQIAAPNVIKIDIEGHEFAAMSGLSEAISNADCRVIASEIHPSALVGQGSSAESFEQLLTDHGFSIQRIASRGREYHAIFTR
jgi:FkbM family methyltransferase